MADPRVRSTAGNLASPAQKETAFSPVREPALPSVSPRRAKLGTLEELLRTRRDRPTNRPTSAAKNFRRSMWLAM
jgi:hypothetical protein